MSTFTADQVWGCAAAAQRINGEYLKEDQWMANAVPPYTRPSNKNLVKKWLREQDFSEVTAADIEAGQTARNHFKTYTLLAIAGKLNDFQRQAMKIAAKDEFTGRDMFDFAVVSCLPEAAVREAAKKQLTREIYASEQLAGEVGDTIQGEITVISTYWKAEYSSYRTQARMGESFIDFWFKEELKGDVKIKGKIKQHRGNKTTQLNYVKKI